MLFSMTFVKGQISDIEINSKKPFDNLFPGKKYVAVFEVKNNSKDTLELNCEFSVPIKFTLVNKIKTIKLKPFQKKILLFPYGVDKHCSSGKYKTAIKIYKKELLVNSKEFKAEVSKFYNLNVEMIDSPEYLRLEKEFYCEYLVTNNGNSEEKINFESSNVLKITPNVKVLQPDSSVVVRVFQQVPEISYTKASILNNLNAHILSKDTIFSDRKLITIYPSTTNKPDLYHRFPIAVSTVYNRIEGTEKISAFKYKVDGSGFLDRENKHFLSINYSGPNQRRIARFGEYDQYSALYRNNKIMATIGDVNFSLSSITELSRYGRGGIFSYKLGKTETSLFYIKPRFTNQISDSYGGKFIYNLTPKTYFQFGFIDRSLFEDEESFKSQLYSLATFYTGDKFKINGEVAFEENHKTNGYGLALESSLNLNKVYIYSSTKYSDKNFKGYLRNSKQFLNSINYYVSKKVGLSANANYSSINPIRDTINYSSSPITSKYQANINYKINRNNSLKIGGYYRTKEDQLFPKKYDFNERLFNLSFHSRKNDKYDLSFDNRIGSTTNFLANDLTAKNVLFSSLNFSFNVWRNFIVGINGDYQETNKQSIENSIEKSFYYGGNLQYNLKSNLDLSFFYRSGYDYDELFDQQSYLEAELNYNFLQNHIFSLSVSQTSIPVEPNKKDYFISAAYTFKINAPLSKDKTIGSITGKIVSKDNHDLEGVLVFLNEKIAATNEKGEFKFYNLKPDSYFISIKQSSLPKGKIVLENTPYQVDVVPNKETSVIFNLGKTGSLNGQIKFKKSKTIQSIKFLKKLPNLIVKISNNSKKYYTKTDNDGYFTFKELAPGEWMVELLVKNLEKDFKFENKKQIIQISSDEISTLEIGASTKNRQIKKSKKTFKL